MARFEEQRAIKVARIQSAALGVFCIAALVALTACANVSAPEYEAEIRRTSHGIVHIKANDDAGIGYGMGYAYAQDNVCLLAQTIVTVNGERARYFDADAIEGPDVESGSIDVPNVQSDYFFKWLNAPQLVEASWRAQGEGVRALMGGYAAGFNRYLADTGIDRLPEACRGAPWVRDITAHDLIRLMRRLTVETSSLSLMNAMLAAAPPTGAGPALTFNPSMPVARELRLGSNAVALGRDATESGRGLLLANPHYPWHGSLRFYQVHATIPGKMDVMGVTLGGMPAVLIGFNQHLAWTHTVNTSGHYTLYALDLDPADPTVYFFNGAREKMVRTAVSVQARGADGKLHTLSHDFWMTRYGPVVRLPGRLDWSGSRAYALRDANLDNHRLMETWYAMNRARSLDDLHAAVTKTLGLPWVNTLAADADGNTLYANVSVVPNVSKAQQERCVDPSHRPLLKRRLMVLAASEQCEWLDDPAAPQAGIAPAAALPVLRRTDYVQNSNDSAWLTNPAAPLTGFAPIVSEQDYEQNDRTRIGISQIQARLAGADGLPGNRFDASSLQSISFSNRSYFGALLRTDLLRICADTSPVTVGSERVEVEHACSAFRGWDMHANLGSTGYALAQAWFAEIEQLNDFWRVPFSVADPINTPRDIDLGNPRIVKSVREALARAVLTLRRRKIDPAKPWGTIQALNLAGVRVPVHGGRYVYNAVVATEEEGVANVRFGTSYAQIVAFDDHGPRARALLAYSQSADPASPHFADQARRFALLDWIELPYTQAQIEADPQYRVSRISQ